MHTTQNTCTLLGVCFLTFARTPLQHIIGVPLMITKTIQRVGCIHDRERLPTDDATELVGNEAKAVAASQTTAGVIQVRFRLVVLTTCTLAAATVDLEP